ncbi:hypothetical protein BXOR1_15785 [Xanthomonas oryzae pv. oryzicola]|nr:hypothetical protein ACU15_06910 [Xanthomonas oryzae pv. oryzicola]KOR46226.1 hypothetical protein ADT27_11045 [Xanthomonas oryzae]OLK87180.1 hypothetical protein BXOR1_15785 [Xanthomonas oryzae pv. oryzicola]
MDAGAAGWQWWVMALTVLQRHGVVWQPVVLPQGASERDNNGGGTCRGKRAWCTVSNGGRMRAARSGGLRSLRWLAATGAQRGASTCRWCTSVCACDWRAAKRRCNPEIRNNANALAAVSMFLLPAFQPGCGRSLIDQGIACMSR